jgi:hypothetical protein
MFHHLYGGYQMTSHFFLSVGLIMIAFSLCYWFRNEK